MEQNKYDVFISYSRKDYVDDRGNVIPENEVSKIMEALSKASISFWFDKEGVIHGEDFGEKILKYIKRSKIFVYLSTTAANESEWTRKEIASAVIHKKKIIPVRIDESPYHDSVMFRIADLDYINYLSNPEKGRKELVEAILRYKAEEQRHREEQERQYRQQEDLRRRQQQAEELRLEISKTEDECSQLEKTLLLKQHDLGVVSLELESKRKHLEEQKRQMNVILFTDEASLTKESEKETMLTQQIEDAVFEFHWSHPRESFCSMWQKIKETMHLRHKIVNVVLCLTLCFAFLWMLGGFSLLSVKNGIALPLCVCTVLSLYALWQLLLNKRSGIVLLLIAPILLMPIMYLSGYNEHIPSLFFPYFYSWRIDECLTISMCFYLAIGFVLLFFLIRKEGKAAWSLLEGKFIHALQIHRHVGFYTVFALLLFLACFCLDIQTREFSNQLKYELKELRIDKDSLEMIKRERDAMKEELKSKENEQNALKLRKRIYSYNDSIRVNQHNMD